MSPVRALVPLLVAPLLLAGCGGSEGSDDTARSSAEPRTSSSAEPGVEGDGLERAADTRTCVADAKPYRGTLPAGFPKDFPRPRGAVLYAVEDRGADGVISTAVVKATLKQVLAVYNTQAQQAGFTITSGETEEHDAEANWEGNGFRGRWALRDSATCDGEVVVQLLSKKQ